MMLSIEDRLAIHQLIDLHGHICDAGAFDRFAEIATEDVVYDVSDLGGGVIRGLDELRVASISLGAGNPIAHMVTNIVIGRATTAGVEVTSKGLGLMESGALSSVVYLDLVVQIADGWRISRRRVIARRTPLAQYDLPIGASASPASSD